MRLKKACFSGIYRTVVLAVFCVKHSPTGGVWQKIGRDTPFFEGGDCEDWAQSYMQIISNIYRLYEKITASVSCRFGADSEALLFFRNVFGFESRSNLEIRMARGIYSDPSNKDQSHTFSVAKHLLQSANERDTSCVFSIIENVVPVLVLKVDKSEFKKMERRFVRKNSSVSVSASSAPTCCDSAPTDTPTHTPTHRGVPKVLRRIHSGKINTNIPRCVVACSVNKSTNMV